MLGKAVKFRHCPATVSAPGSTDVERGNQPELFCPRCAKALIRPLEHRCGKVAGGRLTTETCRWKPARRKSGDRSCALNPLAFRGERRSHHVISYASAPIFGSTILPLHRGANSVRLFCRCGSCCLDS